MISTLIGVLVVALVLVVLLLIVEKIMPDATILWIARMIALLILIGYILNAFGLYKF